MRPWYITLLIILPLTAASQMPDYHVHVFNESTGIRNYVLRSMVRDQNDFLWILYNTRVQRYDGRQVKEFRVSEDMFSMICDAQNRIWCTSRNKVYRFKNDHTGFVPVAIADSIRSPVGYVFELSDHKIYLNTGGSFYVFNEEQNLFTSFQVLRGKPVPINSIKMGAWGNNFFFATSDSIYSYNVSTKILRGLPGKSVFAINALNDHLVLLSDWTFTSYWFDFEKKTVVPVKTNKFLHSGENGYFFTNDLVALDKENYLITTQKGLVLYNAKTDVFKKLVLFREGHVLEDMESLTCIYMDSQRNVWASYDQGLVCFPADEKNLGLMRNAFAEDEKFKWNNDVRKFAEDEKGNIWFATVNGFNYWDLSTGKITHYQGKINSKEFLYPSIRGIIYDGKYLVLGPTNLGIQMFDPKTKQYRRPNYGKDSNGVALKNKIESDFINHAMLLKNGDHLIVGKSGVYILSAKKYFLKGLEIKEDNPNCMLCYQDSQGRIWIGTRYHLFCYDEEYHYLFTAPTIGDGWARCMWERKPNDFLVGSNGLFSFDISTPPYQVKKVNAFFDHSNINIVYKDKRDRFWVASDNGLFLLDLQKNKMRSFDYADNLQGKGFYNQSSFLSSRGILYIGGTNGINYFRPEIIEILDEKLKPMVLNMVVNDDDSSFLEKSLPAHLPYSSNSIRFDFVAPYFGNASKVQYRYTLSGLDNKWKYVQNNTSVYVTALAAGDYSFKIAASINGKDWFESKSIHFTILPPFWRTWWFILTCIFFSCGLIYLIYRYRIAQIMKLQLVRNRISAELHDDIGTKLTNINILSTLTHQAMEEPTKARELLGRISSEVQTSSEALDDIVWNINTKNDSLQEIIPRMRRYASEVLSGKNIQFNIKVPDNLQSIRFSMEKRHDVYLLFKEIVNNIHKHAFADHVIITIEIQDAAFFLHVKDDGKGFDLNQQTSRNGLQNLKARTEKWKGTLLIQSEKGMGSDIKILLPLKKIHSNGV